MFSVLQLWMKGMLAVIVLFNSSLGIFDFLFCYAKIACEHLIIFQVFCLYAFALHLVKQIVLY